MKMQETDGRSSDKRSRLEVVAEDGVADVGDDALRGFRVDDTSQVGIKNALVLIVPCMHLGEVCSEVAHHGIKVVWTVTVRCDVFPNFNSLLQLGLQDVCLVQEENQMGVLEEGVGADLLEKLEGIVYSIRPWIFSEVLIECADWRHEDDSSSIIEVGHPSMTLAPSTADII